MNAAKRSCASRWQEWKWVMEIIGDDKKIRALFSEARVADEAAAPSFVSVWHRAQSRALKPRRAFKLSFAAATAVLVLALGSVAVWSIYFQRSNGGHEAFATVPVPGNFSRPTINQGSDPTKSNDEATIKYPRIIRHSNVRSQGQTLVAASNRKATSKPATI